MEWCPPLTPSRKEKFFPETALPNMKVETRVESVQKARAMRSNIRRACSVWSIRWIEPKPFLSPPIAVPIRLFSLASCLAAASLMFCPAPICLASFSIRRSTSRTLSRYCSSLCLSSVPRVFLRELASSRTMSMTERSSDLLLPLLSVLRKSRSKAL